MNIFLCSALIVACGDSGTGDGNSSETGDGDSSETRDAGDGDGDGDSGDGDGDGDSGDGDGDSGDGDGDSGDGDGDSGDGDGDPGEGDCEVRGELQQWHRVVVVCDGPMTSEDADPSPFTDIRMDVTFTQDGQQIVVPGHFAADADAGNTGASSGNKWRAYFMPREPGQWDYSVSFTEGPDVALDGGGAAILSFDGQSGYFGAGGPGPAAIDLRTRGLLSHANDERYLRFAGNGRAYVEGGVDSPENLLAYIDIDNTIDCPGDNSGILHEYPDHVADWTDSDPSWAGDKGKGLIGAINYLASTGVNAQYMVTMSREHEGVGDDNRIFPWTGCDERFRFDVSKLDQWEVVFEHLTRKGMLVHIVTQETENDHLLDAGELGRERRIYYRELVSRFAHHPGLQWNLGEENTNSSDQVKSYADELDTLDPYDHPILLHTYPDQKDRYNALLGHPTFDGPTLQFGAIPSEPQAGLYGEIQHWLDASTDAGLTWVVTGTEASGNNAPVPDSDVTVAQRVYWMWASVMSGGAGFEWYLKREGQGHAFDHSLENFREFDTLWMQSGYVVSFWRDLVQGEGVELMDLVADNDATSQANDWVLADAGQAYVVFLREGGTVELDLSAANGTFRVTWFDPRTGVSTDAANVDAGGLVPLGPPPSDADMDWAVFLRP